MTGFFITFEGIEGCGKSTQAKLLYDYLTSNGKEALLTREPGGTSISEQIRQVLLDPQNKEMTAETELLLYLASRNQHTQQLIIPALNSGKIVICDRYSDSTLAYQGAARKITLDTIKPINNFATHGLVPDITIILDIPVSLHAQRLQGKIVDRIEAESEAFHNKVREAFLEMANDDKRYIVINGEDKIETIHFQVLHALKCREGACPFLIN